MSNQDDVTVTSYGGGVTRVQHGVEDTQQQNAPSGANHYTGGCLSIDGSSGNVERKEAMQLNIGEPQGEGLLSTARTSYGSPAREITKDSIVEYRGMTMRVQEAEAAGLLSRNDAGRYVEVIQNGNAQPKQEVEIRQPVEAGDISGMKAELFTPEVETMLAALTEGAAPQAINQVLMDAVLNAAKTGGFDDLSIGDVVNKTGLTPENATAFMQSSISLLSAQANHALQELQVDPSQLVEWAMRERPEQFKAAMVQQVSVRSLSGYRALAKEFLRNTTPSAEGLADAGYETMKDPNSKELLVKYKGVWMAAKAAAIQGLI